jgi:transposase
VFNTRNRLPAEKPFTGLSDVAQTVLEQNPFSGHVFVFRGKRGDLIKLLWWEGDGLCLFARRLELRFPAAGGTALSETADA